VRLARAGLGRGVSISLVVLLAGIVLRSVDGLRAGLAGTLLIGVAITVGNVAVPVVIARDLPRRAGPVLGGYTAALNVGSMLTLSLTVPLASALGWRTAVASWGVLVLAALALWAYATRGPIRETAGAADHTGDTTTDDGDDRTWWRRPTVWLLTAAFSGQAFAYYGVTAWLPLLLRDELGMAPGTAGLSASIFQIACPVALSNARNILPPPQGGSATTALFPPSPRNTIVLVTSGDARPPCPRGGRFRCLMAG
jgi:CP family cyanate transporter-like MFS transporter